MTLERIGKTRREALKKLIAGHRDLIKSWEELMSKYDQPLPHQLPPCLVSKHGPIALSLAEQKAYDVRETERSIWFSIHLPFHSVGRGGGPKDVRLWFVDFETLMGDLRIVSSVYGLDSVGRIVRLLSSALAKLGIHIEEEDRFERFPLLSPSGGIRSMDIPGILKVHICHLENYNTGAWKEYLDR